MLKRQTSVNANITTSCILTTFIASLQFSCYCPFTTSCKIPDISYVPRKQKLLLSDSFNKYDTELSRLESALLFQFEYSSGLYSLTGVKEIDYNDINRISKLSKPTFKVTIEFSDSTTINYPAAQGWAGIGNSDIEMGSFIYYSAKPISLIRSIKIYDESNRHRGTLINRVKHL